MALLALKVADPCTRAVKLAEKTIFKFFFFFL